MIRARRLPVECYLLLGLVLASALALTAAPVAVRALLALPVLIGVPGWALSRLLVTDTDTDTDWAGPTGAVLRWALPVLFGVVLLLADALLLALCQIRLGTAALLVGLFDLTGVLLIIGRLPALRRPAAAPLTGLQLRRSGRALAAIGVTAALLGGGLAVARLLQPVTAPSRFQSLILLTPGLGGRLIAQPGGTVTVRWQLRDAAGAPVSTVLVGAAAPARLSMAVTPDQVGSATFAAPTVAGSYRVQVSSGSTAAKITVSTVLTVQP